MKVILKIQIPMHSKLRNIIIIRIIKKKDEKKKTKSAY